jgi:hypothetical protein
MMLLGAVKATAKVIGGGKKGTAKSLSHSEATAVSKEMFHQKQTAPAELQANISRGITEAVESNPLLKAEMARYYRGGIFGELDARRGIIDRHHMPADSSTSMPRAKGTAIQMDTDDHMQTSSWGSSTKAKAYRAMLQQKVDAGDMRGAVATDIWDLKAKTGRKYNKAMLEMIEVGETTGAIPLNQGKK